MRYVWTDLEVLIHGTSLFVTARWVDLNLGEYQ
jgi:hypothetical protein